MGFTKKTNLLKQGQKLAILVFTLSFPLSTIASPIINTVTPSSGSVNGGTSVTIDGSGFESGLGRRTSFTINNANASTLLNYAVRVTFDSQSLIAAGKMRSDCGDIRFRASDGITTIPHFLESGCNTTSTVVWIKPNSLSPGNTTVYMYHGKLADTSTSDPGSVFIFYDNFEYGASGLRVDSNKWPGLDSSPTLTDNAWILTNTSSNEGSLVASNNNMSSQDGVFREMTSQSFTIPSGTSAILDLNWSVSSEANFDYLFYCISQGSTTPNDPSCTRTAGYINRISGTVGWTREMNTSNLFSSGNIGKIKFRYEKDGSLSSGSDRGWVDAIKIRPYTATEPTATIGSEVTTGVDTNYSQAINITSGASLTNHPVRLVFDTQSLISSNKMNSDCSDIRFKARDLVTDLFYYLESGCNTSSTVVWVKVNSLSLGTTPIYMYYGKYDLSSASSGDNVFIFFDNFEGGSSGTRVSASKWESLVSSASLSGDAWVKTNTATSEGSLVGSNNSMSGQDGVYREMITPTITIPSGNPAVLDFNWSSSSESGFDFLFYCTSISAGTPATPGCTRTSGYLNRISGETAFTRENPTASTIAAGTNMKLKFRYEKDSSVTSGSDRGWIDSVKIRPYVSPEPSASFGSETRNGTTITFGSNNARAINNGTSQILAVTPASSTGIGSVTVAATAPDGFVYSLVNGYTYIYVAPSAPTGLTAAAGTSQVNLNWTAPSDDGGQAITDYVIQYRSYPSGSFQTYNDGTSSSTSALVTGLSNGQTYEFQVAAINSAGQSSYSSAVTSTPTVTYTTPVVSSPGFNIGIAEVELTGETVMLENQSGTPNTTPSYTYYSSALEPDLSEDTAYQIFVFSGPTYNQVLSVWIDYNSDGDFTDSGELIADSVFHSANSTATVNFTTPAISGSITAGTKRMRVGSEYVSYSMDPSGNGPNTYGEYEDYDIILQAAPISAPQNLVVQSSSTPQEVTLNWDMPNNNGGYPFDDYLIKYGPNGGNCDPTDFNDADCSTASAPHSPTNPQSGTVTGLGFSQYRFAVFASNTNGDFSATSSNSVVAPPTTVFSVNPNTVTNGGMVNLFIEGTYFFSGPSPAASTVALVRGTTVIPCSIYNEITDTNFDCDFDLSTAQPGIYSIRVTNFDGEIATMANALTINAGPMSLTGITPAYGTTNGGTVVTISGSNFSPTYYQVPYTIGTLNQVTTDYQISLTLDTQTPISEGKMRTDCGDIRIKDQTGTNDLDFWFQGPCNSAASTIWVKMPTIDNALAQRIYVTYGNLNLTSASSAVNTFLRTISGLQANWHYDEGSGDNIADASGNSNDATFFSGGFIDWGKYGFTRLFNSSTYADAGAPTTLDISGSGSKLTIETWVRMLSENNGNYPRLISKLSCAPYNGYELLIGPPDATPSLRQKPYLQLANNGSLSYVSSSSTITPDGNWHHIVATYDSTAAAFDMAKIYVDGVLAIDTNTISSGAAIASSNANLQLAQWPCSGNNFYGYLDETRIYNTALSAQEIADIYNNRSFSEATLPNTLLVRKTTNAGYEPSVTAGTEQGKGLQATFGTTQATDVYTTDGTTLYATTPAHSAGTVDVTVINGNNDSETLTGGFEYFDRRLKIIDLNGGNPIVVNEPFSITVQAVESDNSTPYNVESDTTYMINVNTGTGFLDQFVGTITAGNNQNTDSNYRYDLMENGVILSTEDTTSGNPNHLVLNSTNSAPFNVVTGPPAANPNSTVDTNFSVRLADGIESARITVMLRESDNSPAHDKTVSLGVVGSPTNGPAITPSFCGEVGYPGVTNANGCTAFYVTSLHAGTFTFQVTSVTDSVVITDTADVTFTGPSAANSTLAADRSNALANNQSAIIFTATVKDASNNVFANRPVTLQRTDSNPGATTITAIACPNEVSTPGETNTDGHACFRVTSSYAGTYSFQATNTQENQTFPTTPVSVTFGAGAIWGTTGQPIANAINDNSTYYTPQFQQVITSSDNNYIVIWADNRNADGRFGELTLMAQKFNQSGTPLWTSGSNYDRDGIVVFDADSNTDTETSDSEIYWPRIVSDNNGGAFITWYLRRNSSSEDAKLVGRRLDYNGAPLWGAGQFTTLVDHMHDNDLDYAPQYDIVADEIEGFFLTYREYTGTTYWNGQFYYHHRYADHFGPGGSRVTGDVETWPVQLTSSPSCDNVWGKLLLANQAASQNVVRVIYDNRVSGSCLGDNNKQVPLHIVTLNNSSPNDELKASIANTDMMDNYLAFEPYDTEHGYGYTTGCDGRYAYEQGQPVILNDADGGVFVAYTEICHGDAFTYGYDAQIVVEHIPDATFLLEPGSRIIGQCPANSCSFALSGINIFGTSDGNIDEFFMGWDDRYDLGGQSIQRYITDNFNGYSVPGPFWDSNTGTPYNDPLPISFKAIIHSQGNGVYVINDYPFDGDTSNLARIRAINIDQSGDPYLDTVPFNGWNPTGNQISSLPTGPNINPSSPLNFMPRFSESLTVNNDYLDKVTSDASGNLISVFYRTGYPVYGATSTNGYIQKMMLSSGLPAFESGGQPSEVQLDQNLDSSSIQEQNQSSSSGAKLNNGETVYAWSDNLDKYNGISINPQIRAEKFDEDGDPQWNTLNPSGRSFGIAIHNVEETFTTSFSSPVVIADMVDDVKTGNSIIAFSGEGGGSGSGCIFIQKLEGNGTPIDADNDEIYDWDVNGEAKIVSCLSEVHNLDMTSDDNGGAYLSAQDESGNIHVYHIFSGNGGTDWSNILYATGGESLADYNKIVFNGYVFLIWETNNTSTDTNVRMARLDAVTGGIQIVPSSFNLTGVQANPDVFADPNDVYIYLAYHHFDLPSAGQPGENYIGVQKYDVDLLPQWPTSVSPSTVELNNVTFTGPAPSTSRTNTNPKLSIHQAQTVGEDDTLIVAWNFENANYFPTSTNEGKVFTARLNTENGEIVWGPSNNSEDDNVFWERGVQMAEDGSVGVMASWIKHDVNTGEYYVIIQHIINGVTQIANYGFDLSGTIPANYLLNASGLPLEQILGDQAFSATISWLNIDNGGFNDIYGQAYVDTRQSFNSTLVASPLSVPADGSTASEIELTLLDNANNPLSAKNVSLAVIYGNPGDVVITPQSVCNAESGTAGITNSQGKACWNITSTVPGLIRLAAYNTTDANTVVEEYAELTFSELPTSPTLSTFVADPVTVYNDGNSTSRLTLTLRNTANVLQPGKTVNVTHDGNNVNLIGVSCSGGGPVTGSITDANGQACYDVSSTDVQEVTFTATETAGSVEVDQNPIVSFEPPAISGSLSTIQIISGDSIEPINPAYHDYNLYNPTNASLIRVTVRNILNNLVSGKTVNLSAAPSANIIIRGVSCDNPRQYSGNSSSISDSLGTACFLVYSSQQIGLEEIPVTLSGSIDNSPDPATPITSGEAAIDLFPHAASFINNFRFRNDDGNELTASSIGSTNTPLYNAVSNQAFRLRVGINRAIPQGDASIVLDEFSPTGNADIGPRPLPVPGTLESYRAFPAMAIDDLNNELYVPTADLDPSDPRVRFYVYDMDNLGAAPDSFDLPSGTIDNSLPYSDRLDAPISGYTHIISNTFIDSANQIMYFVTTPYFFVEGTTQVIRVYKVDLATRELIDVLTEEVDFAPNSNDFYQYSLDSEIDLANNLMYLAITDATAKVMKIKLNGPSAAMTKVGLLTIANENLPVTSSLIDDTNQYLYVTTGDPQKIYKIDLNVDANQLPVVVDQIYLVPSPSSSPAEIVGYQASALDPIEGYAYFISSSDNSNFNFDGTQRAFVTKVDIDPNRAFEVIARLSLVDPLGSSADSYYYGEYNYGPLGDRINLVTATPSIDATDHYLYVPVGHYNTPRNKIYRKLMRIKTDDLSTQDIELNEITYEASDIMGFKGNILSPQEDRGYIIRHTADGDVLSEYSSTTKWNFGLQSSPNIDGQYCNYDSLNSYNWTSLPNSDFVLEDSTYYNNGDSTTNVTGLLSDNNESFVPGQMIDSSNSTSTINLGRSEFTEIEYTIKPTNTARGSYCFRVIDTDPNHNNQVSGYPSLVIGRIGAGLSATTDDHFIPITIGGLIVDRTAVNIIEGTTTDSYGIKLASAISDNVTVTINADDSRVVLSPDPTPATPGETTITFNSGNWDTYQYITVSSNNNSLVDGTTTELIHHSVSSSDPAYNNIITQPVTSVVTDYGSSSSNVTATVTGQATFTPPANFAFPDVLLGTSSPNFSPALSLQLSEDRGVGFDYTLTLQATNFCKSAGVCIPLNKVFLATSDLNNLYNTFNNSEIGQFLANYLQTGESTSDRSTYVHANPAEDRTLGTPVTVVDTRNVPSGSADNPLQGALNLNLHLMIDYANISTLLEAGTYLTTLVFDFNTNP